jgi:hypothetical protein
VIQPSQIIEELNRVDIIASLMVPRCGGVAIVNGLLEFNWQGKLQLRGSGTTPQFEYCSLYNFFSKQTTFCQ